MADNSKRPMPTNTIDWVCDQCESTPRKLFEGDPLCSEKDTF